MKGQRSAAYPSYSIAYALEFSEKIYKNYGLNYRAKREDISKALNISIGALTQKISAAVQYGFLDMKSNEGYLLTELYSKYRRPINEEEKHLALINAFKNPPLYEAIIEIFEDGILPPPLPLSNILFQNHNISESACEKAASIFEENAKFVGVLKEDRTLSFTKSISVIDEAEVEEEVSEIEETQNETSLVQFKEEKKEEKKRDESTSDFEDFKDRTDSKVPILPILLKGRRTAHLGLPNDFTTTDLDTIINWIRLMKESM